MTNPTKQVLPESEKDDTPMANLGIAGNLTRFFIISPLTPLFLIAALAFGLVALMALPREEEPQISVPMVDITVQAPGLKADDAEKLITQPLETIVKSINGVEHIYSRSMDNQVVVTARFLVGTSPDAAVLRVHDKVNANLDRIPVGIAEPKIVGRGIDDVAITTLTFRPATGAQGDISANDLTRIAREVRNEIAKVDNVGLTYLVGETNEILRSHLNLSVWRSTASPFSNSPRKSAVRTRPSRPARSVQMGSRSMSWPAPLSRPHPT